MNSLPPLTLEHFKTKVSNQYQKFSEAELKVAECIEQSFHNMPYFGITDISLKSETSKATVGRFLNKIGFLGFSRFKSAVNEALRNHKLPLPIEQLTETPCENDKNILDAQIKDAVDNLSLTSKEINPKAFSDTVDLLTDLNRKIFVYSPTAADSVASHLVTLARYTRKDIFQLGGNVYSYPHQLIDTRPGDVLFVISYLRCSNVGIQTVKWFKNMGGKVILLTYSPINPYAPFSDVELLVSSKSRSVFQSRSTAMVIAEALLSAMTARLGEPERFQKMETLFDELDAFQDW